MHRDDIHGLGNIQSPRQVRDRFKKELRDLSESMDAINELVNSSATGSIDDALQKYSQVILQLNSILNDSAFNHPNNRLFDSIHFTDIKLSYGKLTEILVSKAPELKQKLSNKANEEAFKSLDEARADIVGRIYSLIDSKKEMEAAPPEKSRRVLKNFSKELGQINFEALDFDDLERASNRTYPEGTNVEEIEEQERELTEKIDSTLYSYAHILGIANSILDNPDYLDPRNKVFHSLTVGGRTSYLHELRQRLTTGVPNKESHPKLFVFGTIDNKPLEDLESLRNEVIGRIDKAISEAGEENRIAEVLIYQLEAEIERQKEESFDSARVLAVLENLYLANAIDKTTYDEIKAIVKDQTKTKEEVRSTIQDTLDKVLIKAPLVRDIEDRFAGNARSIIGSEPELSYREPLSTQAGATEYSSYVSTVVSSDEFPGYLDDEHVSDTKTAATPAPAPTPAAGAGGAPKKDIQEREDSGGWFGALYNGARRLGQTVRSAADTAISVASDLGDLDRMQVTQEKESIITISKKSKKLLNSFIDLAKGTKNKSIKLRIIQELSNFKREFNKHLEGKRGKAKKVEKINIDDISTTYQKYVRIFNNFILEKNVDKVKSKSDLLYDMLLAQAPEVAQRFKDTIDPFVRVKDYVSARNCINEYNKAYKAIIKSKEDEARAASKESKLYFLKQREKAELKAERTRLGSALSNFRDGFARAFSVRGTFKTDKALDIIDKLRVLTTDEHTLVFTPESMDILESVIKREGSSLDDVKNAISKLRYSSSEEYVKRLIRTKSSQKPVARAGAGAAHEEDSSKLFVTPRVLRLSSKPLDALYMYLRDEVDDYERNFGVDQNKRTSSDGINGKVLPSEWSDDEKSIFRVKASYTLCNYSRDVLFPILDGSRPVTGTALAFASVLTFKEALETELLEALRLKDSFAVAKILEMNPRTYALHSSEEATIRAAQTAEEAFRGEKISDAEKILEENPLVQLVDSRDLISFELYYNLIKLASSQENISLVESLSDKASPKVQELIAEQRRLQEEQERAPGSKSRNIRQRLRKFFGTKISRKFTTKKEIIDRDKSVVSDSLEKLKAEAKDGIATRMMSGLGDAVSGVSERLVGSDKPKYSYEEIAKWSTSATIAPINDDGPSYGDKPTTAPSTLVPVFEDVDEAEKKHVEGVIVNVLEQYMVDKIDDFEEYVNNNKMTIARMSDENFKKVEELLNLSGISWSSWEDEVMSMIDSERRKQESDYEKKAAPQTTCPTISVELAQEILKERRHYKSTVQSYVSEGETLPTENKSFIVRAPKAVLRTATGAAGSVVRGVGSMLGMGRKKRK